MKSEQIAGNEPAFPCPADIHGKSFQGLTKRQYVATEIAKSFLQTNHIRSHSMNDNPVWVKQFIIGPSFALADAILNYDK